MEARDAAHQARTRSPVVILHVSNTDIEGDSRIRKEIRALGGLAGARVHVIGVSANENSGQGAVDGAGYIRLRMLSRLFSRLPRAARYFLELIEFTAKAVGKGRLLAPDVVHCHDTFALPAGWLLKKLTGCRLVYDAHELESDKNGQSTVLAGATLLIERACWRSVNLLVSVSDSIIEWYAGHLGPKPSVLILNSPMIDDSGKDLPGAGGSRGGYFRRTFGIPVEHVVFVYLGILGPGRGIETCLQAFEKGPAEAHAVFIGFGVLKEEILRYAARCQNIHFHEAVAHDRVVPLVRDADYGLCLVENASLSDYYCLPNKLFEYCFAGLPVLASNFPEIAKLVGQYSLGVCCDPELADVQSALGALMSRPRIRIAADVSALSWQAQAARLRRAYEEQLFGSAIPADRPGVDCQY